jgi:hypothetical protein
LFIQLQTSQKISKNILRIGMNITVRPSLGPLR